MGMAYSCRCASFLHAKEKEEVVVEIDLNRVVGVLTLIMLGLFLAKLVYTLVLKNGKK
jgi:hypothetical protein